MSTDLHGPTMAGAIVAATIGGLALIGVILMLVFLYVQKGNRERKSDMEEGYNRADRVTEKDTGFPAISPISPKVSFPPRAYYGRMDSMESLSTMSSESSSPVRQPLPKLKIPTTSDSSKPAEKKWNLKRVPVPRFSRMPPSPAKLLLRSPMAKRFSKKFGLPKSVRPVECPPVPQIPVAFTSSNPASLPLARDL
jgi:hypothetical protein